MYNKIIKEFNELAKTSTPEYINFMHSQLGGASCQDVLLGIKVPIIRQLAKKYKNIDLDIIERFVTSNIHEYKLFGLFIMCIKYKDNKENIYNLYLKIIKSINNWDLIDYTAYKIIGAYCFEAKDENIIYKLANSQNVWYQRIAILSGFYYIKNKSYKLSYTLCKNFLTSTSSCIHKATGWQLREIGKKDKNLLINFLDKYSSKMPRTMLRYSIEHLSTKEKKYYMNKL